MPSDGESGSISTIEQLPPRAERRTRSSLHGATTLALAVIVGLAFADGLDVWDVYGVDSSTARASADGYELAVTYGTVTRPALATPFDIEIRHAGGFDEPVTVVVDRDYWSMWDENGLSPAPSAETSRGEWIQWEFDPPVGDTLSIAFDARIEPAAQRGRDGSVGLVVDDEIIARVDFHTTVRP
jgi:hypothetical protein